MKNLILLILSITLTGCWGTDQGEGKFYEYTIKNESGVNIAIEAYFQSFPNTPPKSIFLDNGDELTQTYQDVLPPSPYDFGHFFGEVDRRRDSIKVIYNNLKVDFLNGECDNERSPLNNCIYRSTKEIFVFTEQDFENAQPCNNNCD